MSGHHRKAILVSAALVGGAMLMTACQGTDTATDTGATQSSSAAAGAGNAATPSGTSTAGGGQSVDKGSGATGKGSKDGAGSGADTGNGERQPVGQSCGANDISWSTKPETQAGGYILIIAKAKSGITCYLPAALPTVAFGSDGTQAGPAEQSAAKQIKLSGTTTAYAGVNPKTTNGNGGKELDSIIVGVGDNDPNPVSLPVGTITVEHPIVTNWHTAPADAVPFG
ncbi:MULTISPECIES: DUF4232 domain-containing protein [unclassified Streptomyces]|uniref:DUF4232 domain-containing protein n=1 Tax=unclassified Streptomyces TaxID=2593676 RepID=UPI00224EF9B8|nr:MULTISPECIES: DUF4232 domain-containing protein [unclassified Streptomyces]MCX5053964.1 DUF4232 domain-containing protein [Streptomyces sp. NBC_00474]